MKGLSPPKNVRIAVIALLAIALLCPAAGEALSADVHGIPHAVASEKKRCKRSGKGSSGKSKKRKCRRKAAPAPSAPAKVTLTVVRTNPAGGTVDSSPTGISCGTICFAQFDPGTPIQLNATADSAYFLKGWSGAGCSGHGVCSFVINADTTIQADLVPKVTVDADVGAGNGTVEVSAPSAPYGVCTGLPPTTCTVLQGDDVTIAATADIGSHFDQWTGDCAGTIDTYTFTAIAPPGKSCHASFAINTYSVSVQKLGSGTGSVSSSPPGISCGLTCSASFAHGTSVTLSAAPDSGSTFAGWSGACSGTGACTLTITAARSVSATFDPS
jgi:hypothetical protein